MLQNPTKLWSRRLMGAAAVLLAAGLLMPGCRQDPEPTDRWQDRPDRDRERMDQARPATGVDDVPRGDDMQGVQNLAALDGIPAEVRQQVMADLDEGARITNVSTTGAEGQVFYRVTFIQNGTPRAYTYDQQGMRIPDIDDPRRQRAGEAAPPREGIFPPDDPQDEPLPEPREPQQRGPDTPGADPN